MDWSYVSFSISEGVIGLWALLAPVPLLMVAATRGRWLTACAPGLVSAASFVTLAVVSGITTHASPAFLGLLPFGGLLLSFRFVLPAIGVLRSKWVGLLHLLTAAGAL